MRPTMKTAKMTVPAALEACYQEARRQATLSGDALLVDGRSGWEPVYGDFDWIAEQTGVQLQTGSGLDDLGHLAAWRAEYDGREMDRRIIAAANRRAAAVRRRKGLAARLTLRLPVDLDAAVRGSLAPGQTIAGRVAGLVRAGLASEEK